ncbi:MAG: hypothetical protein R3310_06250, partial [Candidatus Competibacteraceae bacterium]|nr:hypothetical protein [Candidatus Competibacteraceae bacterium]
MSNMEIVALIAAAILALIHLFAGKLRFLEGIPRSRWLSLAGGASIAYVFLHLLPELATGQETLAGELAEPWSFVEHHIYVLALVGLAIFYGLERLTRRHRRQRAAAGREDCPSSGVFWIHILSFALYNFLIGYLLLHLEELDLRTLLLFALA